MNKKTKMKKMFYAFIALLIIGVIHVACTNQENENPNKVNLFKVEGKVAYNKKTKQLIIKEESGNKKSTLAKENDTLTYISLKHQFICDSSMPNFNSSEELELFLTKNPGQTNGVFEFYIDDELSYRIKIVNGEKSKVLFMFDTSTSKNYPCTYSGIRACAIGRIHGQNWYEMWGCVAAGFGCVVDNYASCMVDNC